MLAAQQADEALQEERGAREHLERQLIAEQERHELERSEMTLRKEVRKAEPKPELEPVLEAAEDEDGVDERPPVVRASRVKGGALSSRRESGSVVEVRRAHLDSPHPEETSASLSPL